jgi:hypothetical protein
MQWLFRYGFLKFYDFRDDWTHEVDEVLVHQLSLGRVAAVLHFSSNFLWEGSTNRSRRRNFKKAEKLVIKLARKAFDKAMDAKSYGIAAALGQLSDLVPCDDRLRAIELAVIHDQTITFQWAFTDH